MRNKKGLEDNLDVSIYAKPEFNWGQMMQIREGLEEEQMAQIREGLESGLDVSVYADPKFRREQMCEIREGLGEGLNVLIYAKPEFKDEQMHVIRRGLEKGIDISAHISPKLSWSQMEEILEKFTEPSGVGEIDGSSGFLDHINAVVEEVKQEQQALTEKQIKPVIAQGEER